jgi:hypothetical protein
VRRRGALAGPSLAAFCLVVGVVSPAEAEPRPPALGSPGSRALAASSWPQLFVGVGVEHTQKDVAKFGQGQDVLVGPTIAARIAMFEPHLELLLTPLAGTYEKWRALANLGGRTQLHAPVLGEFSLGFAFHAEARLEDHFALLSFTPIEFGTVAFRKGSFQVRLFIGLRAAFTGTLIDSYLIDPNGFRDEEAQAALQDATLHTPWRGFVRFAFERRVR